MLCCVLKKQGRIHGKGRSQQAQKQKHYIHTYRRTDGRTSALIESLRRDYKQFLYFHRKTGTGHKACAMKTITENIRAYVFQNGSFLYNIELKMPDGDLIDKELLQIEKVTCIKRLTSHPCYFTRFFHDLCFRLESKIEISTTKHILILANLQNT